MNKQLFISGPAGSGKTKLARYISTEYAIPFVSGSTKNLWKERGITSHSQIIKRSITEPEWGLEFQMDVLEYRESKLRGLDSFVTDRSPLDNMLYFLLQNSPWLLSKQTDRYLAMCKNQYNLYTNAQLIYLEPHGDKLENDGMRINNVHYQEMTHMVMKGILERNWLGMGKKALVIKEWDWDIRRDIIDNFLYNQTPTICGSLRRKLGL